MNITIESVHAPISKVVIEWYLSCFGTGVKVVGSLMTEDGYESVSEGEAQQVMHLVQVLGEGASAKHN